MKTKYLQRFPLGSEKRVWKQDRFLLSTFSFRSQCTYKAMETLQDAGFNLIEFGWAPHKDAEAGLRVAQQLGIDVLFQDFSVFGGMQHNHLERIASNETVQAVVDHLRPYDRCIGEYVWDEPYGDEQLAVARKLVDAFQHYAPEKLHFTVAIPSYNSKFTWQNGLFASYLEDYVCKLEPPVLSLDYYPIGLHDYSPEKQLDDSLMWCDLGLMRKLGQKYQLPIWFYYQGVDLYGCHVFNYTQTRMMMYAACLYGVKGLQQYTALDSVIKKDGTPGPYFEEQKQLNREFAMLGKVLMALESRYVFHSDDLLPGVACHKDLADDIGQSDFLAAKLPKRTSVGELTDAYGNTYLLVVNRDYDAPLSLNVALKERFRLYPVDRKDGRTHTSYEADTLSLDLAPGDGALLRIEKTENPLCALEYVLQK